MPQVHDLSQLLKDINILYVEDDATTREAMSDVLSKFSNNIFYAKNAEEALMLYQQNSIQLLITDIEMPKVNGIQLIREIRKENLTIPIIIITAFSTSDYLLTSINLHIQGYIIKPINYTVLKEALYKVVKYLNLTSNLYLQITPDILYDKINGIVFTKDKNEIHLNRKEKALMNILIEKKNKLVTYSQIEHAVWNNYDEIMTDNALRTLIKTLRKKSTIHLIENIAGLGYKLSIPYE